MPYRKPRYRFLYSAGFLLALSYAFTVYINSSLLGQYFSTEEIGRLYVTGSLITILCLLASPRVIKKFGNWKLVLVGITLEIIALLVLAFSKDAGIIKIAFIAHQALPALIVFGLDLFFEGILITSEDTEKVRSYYLTSGNVAFVCAPFIVGLLASSGSFSTVYCFAAFLLLLVWLLIYDIFKRVEPKKYHEVELIRSIKKFITLKSLKSIFFLNFLLHSFYVVMVIFMAPFLHTKIGFSWSEIGIIYTVMLLPFVIFEAPLGKIFNYYHNEKDILISGFLIMSVAVALMSFTSSTSVVVWTILLFTSRVGASFVEVASEAAFFKRVTDQDASLISIFRQTSPLAYVVAPLIAVLIVPALPVTTLFMIVSVCLLIGMSASYKLSI